MTKFCAPAGATAKLCLPDVVTLDRRQLENALVDLDQSVAANDHFGYEAAYQTILAMIPQTSVIETDALQGHDGSAETSPEAIASRRLAVRDARYQGRSQ